VGSYDPSKQTPTSPPSGQLWPVKTNSHFSTVWAAMARQNKPSLLHRLAGKIKWSGEKRWRPRVNKMAAVGSTWRKFFFLIYFIFSEKLD